MTTGDLHTLLYYNWIIRTACLAYVDCYKMGGGSMDLYTHVLGLSEADSLFVSQTFLQVGLTQAQSANKP